MISFLDFIIQIFIFENSLKICFLICKLKSCIYLMFHHTAAHIKIFCLYFCHSYLLVKWSEYLPNVINLLLSEKRLKTLFHNGYEQEQIECQASPRGQQSSLCQVISQEWCIHFSFYLVSAVFFLIFFNNCANMVMDNGHRIRHNDEIKKKNFCRRFRFLRYWSIYSIMVKEGDGYSIGILASWKKHFI